MGESSKIEWTDHTFNPWWGCVRVSPGCERCYAETFAKRTGNPVWGVQAPRRFFGDKHWDEPLKWDISSERSGVRKRVFCASMADVFEDRDDLNPHRERLWRLIRETPALDWLVLTKRPENIARLGDDVLAQCWVGVTAEDQKRADERVPLLLQTPAAVRFASAEPLLGPVDFNNLQDGHTFWTRPAAAEENALDWVIVGSESGPGARTMKLEWARSIVDQCVAAGVPVFTKQIANEHDRKGGDPQHWPPGVWPREFPEARHG